jgi:ubiquinone/menaquinone biosynthesis C-methylase UbiE
VSGARTKDGVEASDFRWLDFTALWRGRDKTTAVERRLVQELFELLPAARILEVGAGEGRITAALAARAARYTAVDRHTEFLKRMRASVPRSVGELAANAYRLPFRAESFDGVVMVRLYNFLRDPVDVLTEFHRVLVPGGWVLVSFNPRPSWATLVDDLRCWLWNQPDADRLGQTLSHNEVEAVRPSPVPAWTSTTAAVHRRLEESGFELVEERASGFEDYRGLKRLPVRAFIGAARAFPTAPGFPHRFVLARRLETASPGTGYVESARVPGVPAEAW